MKSISFSFSFSPSYNQIVRIFCSIYKREKTHLDQLFVMAFSFQGTGSKMETPASLEAGVLNHKIDNSYLYRLEISCNFINIFD